MADTTAGAQAPALPAPKGLSKKTLLIAGAAVLLLAAGAGAFLTMKGGKEKPAEAPAAEEHAAAKGEAGGHGAGAGKEGSTLYDLDSFVVNLADQPEARYLKLTLKLELERPELAADLAARVPQVRDAVLILLTSKDSMSLRSTQGKFQLRDEITHRVNTALPKGGVRTVYFTEFVVQ